MINKKKFSQLDPDEILVDSVSILESHGHLDRKMERPLGKVSSLLFLVFAASGIAYLAFRAFTLQITQGESFFAKSQENRFVVRNVSAPRGIIYDYRGDPLVDNVPSFGLVFEKAVFMEKGGSLSSLVALLTELLNKDKIFFEEIGFLMNDNPADLPQRIFLAENLSVDIVVKIASHLDDLPGVRIFESFRRQYRNPYSMSHLLGFTGKISEEDLRARPELGLYDSVGKSGIEAAYDNKLRGRGGEKIAEIDSQGIETRFKFAEEYKEGSRLRLAVDGGLQRISYEIMQNYTEGKKGGSVAVLDVNSGAVRTLVSFPGFDSNRFGSDLTQKEFEAVLNDSLKPMFNRVITGEFPAGSTIKPFLGAAVLEEKLIDPAKKIYDEGFIEIPNPYRPGEKSVFLDWRKHGWVDFYDAIAVSANVYFYAVGGGWRDQEGLGIKRIKKYAFLFGLGSRLGIDIAGEKPGVIPDPEWKKTHDQDPVWRIGDTYNVSIGQGGVKVTPLQMAAVTATIANGGTLYQPYVAEVILDGKNEAREKIGSRIIRENIVSKEVLSEVRRAMRQTVTSGTARLLDGLPVAVAAKTGTAQSTPGRKPHAWVIAFAPYENPEIAIAVMVEYAGEGATVAVPITNEILKWYFTHKNKKIDTPI